jgi:hypothetical protein
MTALRAAAQAALEALEHHTQQTRPIQRTEAAILGLREALSEECAAVRTGAAPVPQGEPYCYIYEYNTALGLHREFYPRRWNGQEPDRSVPVYLVSPQPAPTPQRVAQPLTPLTDEQIDIILERERMKWAGGPPTYEFSQAFARAIEAAHGIGAAAQPGDKQ